MAAALRRFLDDSEHETSNCYTDMAILAMRKAGHYSFCTWNTDNVKVVHRDFRSNDVTVVRADNSCVLIKREFHAIVGVIGVCYLKNGSVYALSTMRNNRTMACGVLSYAIVQIDHLLDESSAEQDEYGIYWFESPSKVCLKISFQNFDGLSFHELRAYGVASKSARITSSEDFYPLGSSSCYPTTEQAYTYQRDVLRQLISTHGLRA